MRAALLMNMQGFQLASLIITLSALQIVQAQSSEFPIRAGDELANLREGTTLAAWMGAHPNDTTTTYSHRHWEWGNWIVRAEQKRPLADGYEMVRRAYFYAPEPPADMRLPRGKNQPQIRATARLGLIWIEMNEANGEAGQKLAERTREDMSQHFGKGQYDLKLSFANAAYWSKTAKWMVGTATFASAYESSVDRMRPGCVLAFGLLPVSGLHIDFGAGDDIYAEMFNDELASLDATIAASGAAEKELAPIRLVKERIEEYHSGKSIKRSTPVADEVVDALRRWLSGSRKRGRHQYAAGLLAADTALDLSTQLFVEPDDEAIRKQLKSIGANFSYAQLDGYVYTHDWLKKALRLDRGEPIGGLALISMMEKGFDLSAMCADTGYEGFRRVIFAGERFLRWSHNQKLRARVHLLVAKAYSDIVALADGAGDGYVEAEHYQRAAPWSRLMAVTHYRRSIELIEDDEQRTKMWKAAWRLLAGTAPTGTNFFCVYD